MRPHVFISLASDNLGGPVKALLHLLRFGGLQHCHLVFTYFVIRSGYKSEYAKMICESGANAHPLYQQNRYDTRLIGQAMNVVIHENCQILESHGYKSHMICALIKLRTGLPWIAFVHGWTLESMRVRLYRYLEMILVCMATRVVPVSNALTARLPFPARRKATVIPNAVDPCELQESEGRNLRLELGISTSAKILGVVGRLSPEKGQVYFLRALAKSLHIIPGLVGLLIGDGPDRAMLEAEAGRLGLGNSVIFTGHVQRMGDYYRTMDLMVLPSLNEGMPNVILEAMLFGKPIVASRVGGVPEVLVDGKTGLMVPPRDEMALCNAIVRVLTEAKLRQLFGSAARNHVIENFSPQARTEKVIAMYRDLVKK